MGGLKGEQKWRLDRTGAPEVWLRAGRGSGNHPVPGRTLRGSDQGGARPAFPLPNWLGKSARLSGRVLCPQKSPLDRVGPGGTGERPGENRRGSALWDTRSRRGAEDVCPTHLGPGSLLSS